MKEKTGSRLANLCLSMMLAVISLGTVALRAQETGGTLTGVVKDSSGAVIVGATVKLTEMSTERGFTAMTSSEGRYSARNLPPGRYTVRFEMSGFAPGEVADVVLTVGKTLQVNGSLQVGTLEQAVTVVGEAPLIDFTGAAVGHNVTSEEINRLPKGRSFQGVLATAPSVTSGVDQFGNIVGIEGGFQVNGSSSAENNFNIDGVSTTSLVNGRSRQNAVLEFVQEVQVKSSGIDAEYGGALGGVLSAVTKSGTNQFHGDVHYFLGGNRLSAGPIKRLLLDPIGERNVSFVQDDKFKDDRHEFGGSFGGPLLQDKMWFFVAASPQWRRRTNEYLFNAGTEPDEISQKRLDQNVFTKLSFDPTSRIRTNLTWLWTPTASTGRLPAYNNGSGMVTANRASNQINKQIGFFQPQSNYGVNVDITLSPRMLLSLKAGRFWDNFKDTGIPGITAVEYRTPTASLPANLQANIPAEQRGGVLFGNTPRLQNSFFDITARTHVQADFSVLGSFMGEHDVKLGIGTMKNVNKVDNSYPGGGYVLVYWNTPRNSLVPGSPCAAPAAPCGGAYGHYEVNDFGTRGTSGANISNIYVQDKWKLHPQVSLSLGVRFEKETVPSFQRNIKDTAIEFDYTDKIAPRLGIAYDYFGDGRLKLSASWGRFYDWVKYELVRGTFGGDVWRIYYRALDTPNAFSLSRSNSPGRDIWDERVANSFRNRRVPGFDFIIPGIKPMSTELFNTGAEYQISPQLVMSAHYVHNGLRRTIEDLGVLVDGDEVYYYANPGEGGAQITPPSGATRQQIRTPRAVRNYDAMELSLTKRYSSGWFGHASYVYSRLFGNYSGTAASEEIRTPTTGVSASAAQQQGGNITRQGGNANRAWDIDELLFDSHGKLDVQGRLPTDRPHQLKLYGSKMFTWRNYGTEFGMNFFVSSGTPMTTYVVSDHNTELFVEGRGDMGRTPLLSQTDLLVAQEFNVRENQKVRVEFNMVNLFNQKTARHIYNYLNRGGGAFRASSAISLGNTDLFRGYDYKSMIANTTDGRNPNLGALDPRYGREDLWNPGFQARLGIRYTF